MKRTGVVKGVRGAAIVAAAAAVAACASGPAGAAQLKKVAEKTFEFAPGGEVVIDSKNGRIVIEAWDRPSIRLQITREVRAPEERQAEALLRNLRADVDVTPGKMEIVSRYPKRKESVGLWDFLGRKVASMDIHYYLQVPRETALTLETTNGEIRVRGTAKRVQASTTNGDVRISGATGSLDAQTTNGELQLAAVSGGVTGSTTNGSIEAEIRSLPSDGAIQLTTTNGNVTVSLPPSVKASLQASTTNGKVTTSFPMTVNGTMSSKAIHGTIGGSGRTAIALVTTNGDINILKLGEREP